MKKILPLLLFISVFANAQILTIPDVNFKTALLNASPSNTIANMGSAYIKIDVNNDGEIQQSEADQVQYLNITGFNISSIEGIHGFTNLMYFNCNNNNLTVADVHGMTQLRTFSCDHNMISTLNVSGCTNMYTLVISYNPPLLSLDASNLYALQNLTLNENMVSINLSNCTSLTSFSYTYASLSELNVSGCTAMTSFMCLYTYMTSLDLSNLTSLTGVNCSSNQLQTLNIDGCLNLHGLNCSDNHLTNLDVSSFTNLTQLNCKLNALHALDVSALSQLTNLDCSYNDLYSLNIKNGTNEAPIFNQNPHLKYICIDEAQLTPGFLYLAGPSVNVNTYCSFVPGGDYNTIFGTLTVDADGNGCDPSDMAPNHFGLHLTQGTNQSTIYTDFNGNYSFYPLTGIYTATPFVENPTWFSIVPPSVTVSFPANNNTAIVQNFCIAAVGTHNDLEVTVLPTSVARPGFDANYQLIYKNKGNQMLSGDLTFNYDDSRLDFVSATLQPDALNAGALNWNFTNLRPFESRSINVVMNVNSPQEIPGVNNGDILNFNATVNPASGDETPLDNIFVLNQMVVNSLDPNEKTCLEGTTVSSERIGDYLHYAISYENTGSASAENIVIKDVIDATKFDTATLQVITASHPVVTRVTGNKVEFIFENINLGAAAHGNVAFKIKTRSNLTVGSTVSNKAHIFFDYNFPIATNTATSVFQLLKAADFKTDASIKIYPNPASDFITVQAKGIIKAIQLFDLQGRIVATQLVDDTQQRVDISKYATGIYLIKVTTEQGTKSEKIVLK